MALDQDVSRRDVLKTAGAVTAAAAVITSAPAIQKVRAANDQVQFGMIGTGSRGSYLLKHLKGIDNGRCVALCDIDEGTSATASPPLATVRRLTRTTASCWRRRMWTRCMSRCPCSSTFR